MADKDVEVTEVTAEPTEVTAEPTAGSNGTAPGPAKPANPAQPRQSDLAQSGVGKSQTVQHEVVRPADGQAEASPEPAAEASPDPAAGASPDPAEGDPAEDEPGGTESAETAPGGRRTWRAAAALGAATVVLAGFGVWATLHASSLRSNAAAQSNSALTDGPATAAVRREISAAVNTIFSYNYADTAATQRAAQAVLTGPAVREYNTLFALVTKDAPTQKLVVATRVTNSGVELLNGNRARVLIFADQQDTRSGTSQTSYAGTMFAVTALRHGGRWKIENIDTFSG